MLKQQSFHRLLEELRQRDEGAAHQVYQRFAQRLIALAHSQLDPRFAQKLDAEDVVQSVFHSVFLRLSAGHFILGDWDSLWALLAAVSVNKCRKWVEYYRSQRRDLTREVSSPANAVDGSWHVIDREPSPEEAIVLKETLEEVLTGLDQREQDMVNLNLQGHEVAEVSQRLGYSEAKVYRVLRLVRSRLERLIEIGS